MSSQTPGTPLHILFLNLNVIVAAGFPRPDSVSAVFTTQIERVKTDSDVLAVAAADLQLGGAGRLPTGLTWVR